MKGCIVHISGMANNKQACACVLCIAGTVKVMYCQYVACCMHNDCCYEKLLGNCSVITAILVARLPLQLLRSTQMPKLATARHCFACHKYPCADTKICVLVCVCMAVATKFLFLR